MAKTLIIAEKPSVAGDIASALGGFKREGDHFENDEYVISSAVGHLLELHAPEEFEVKRGKWTFTHLPVIPPHFDLRPIARSEARLKQLARLIKRKDVTSLINACDAGREGELIFRYIVQATKAKQPIRRLWLQSMTPASIREAFTALRTDDEMQPLADAARSRSEADWLVGINGTRAMTAFNRKDGGFYLTTVGRVQTPTLAIVVEREERSASSCPATTGRCARPSARKAGAYEARWFDAQFKKDEGDPERRRRAPLGSQARRGHRRRLPRQAGHASPRNRSRAPSSRRCCSTSPRCSARPTAVSGSPQKRRCRSRRRCTKGTRCSPIRAPTPARCPRTTSRYGEEDPRGAQGAGRLPRVRRPDI